MLDKNKKVNEKQIDYNHLLGFNQLNTVCETLDDAELLEDAGRLLNKIGEIL